MDDPRQPADVAMGADGDELVQSHSAGDRGEGVDMDMAGEHGVVGHEDPVAQHAVVADVNVGHQVAVGADPREPCFLLGAAMDGDGLAEDVVVSDLEARGLALVRIVLGFAARGRRRGERRCSRPASCGRAGRRGRSAGSRGRSSRRGR